MLDEESADGIGAFLRVARAEGAVEIGDLGDRLDAVAAAGLGQDVVRGLVEVVLVLDVADDLLEHVLDRDQARDAAIFVDHDRHVVAARAELAQEHIEPLRLRHEHRRAQHLAHVEFLFARVVTEKILGQ